jgi:hypothetical protein
MAEKEIPYCRCVQCLHRGAAGLFHLLGEEIMDEGQVDVKRILRESPLFAQVVHVTVLDLIRGGGIDRQWSWRHPRFGPKMLEERPQSGQFEVDTSLVPSGGTLHECG